jgi:hypothetical protein
MGAAVFVKVVARLGVVSGLSFLFSSCSHLVLPDFDGGLLNPDIRLLRAGEVMEGMKCALVAFMSERESDMLHRRIKDKSGYFSRLDNLGDLRKRYSPYEINIDKDQDATLFYRQKPKEFNCGLNKHYGHPLTKGGKEITLLPRSCVQNRCDVSWTYSTDRRLGASVWDYSPKKTSQGQTGCAPVPDYSRFALDATQTATIELTLTGINTGFINYGRIDAIRTPFFPFITTGNTATGAPFPTLTPTAKGTTIFDMSAVIPQSIHTFQETARGYDFVGGITPSLREELREERNVRMSPPPGPPTQKEIRDLISAMLSDVKPYIQTGAPNSGNKNLSLQANLQLLEKALNNSNIDWESVREPLNEVSQTIKDFQTADRKKSEVLDGQLMPIIQLVTDLKRDLTDYVALADGSDKSLAEYQGASSKLAKKMAAAATQLTKLLMKIKQSIDEKPPFNDPRLTAKYKKGLVPYDAYSSFIASLGTELVSDQVNEFEQRCHVDTWTFHLDDSTRIDYLALKALLNKVVEEQENAVYHGIPDLTMSQLVLTSSFELTLEVSAGTSHFFRIVPLLAPPNTDLKADHTHLLKITLNGKKQKGDPQLSKNLAQSCHQRLDDKSEKAGNGAASATTRASRAGGGSTKAGAICDTDAGKLLESMIEALQNGSGSGGGAQ